MTGTDVVIVPPEGDDLVRLGVVYGNRPAEVVQRATEAADALAAVIKAKKLFSSIQGKEYVRVEGWTTLAAMMGCLPKEVSSVRRDDGTYEATVELVRMSDGVTMTRASAECGMDEPVWAKRPDYARRSMAATRATSKACRLAFSWVMVLAGFQPTPAEEIPHDSDGVVTRPDRVTTDTANPVKGARSATQQSGKDAKHPSPGGPVAIAEIVQPLSEIPHQLQQPEAPTPTGGPVWLFGSKKGVALSLMRDEELTVGRAWLVKKNKTGEVTGAIAAVDAELKRRTL